MWQNLKATCDRFESKRSTKQSGVVAARTAEPSPEKTSSLSTPTESESMRRPALNPLPQAGVHVHADLGAARRGQTHTHTHTRAAHSHRRAHANANDFI